MPQVTYTCSACGRLAKYGHIDSLCLECFSKTHSPREIRIRKNQESLFDYLNDKECADCGEADSRVLQFDHVYGGKLANVAEMVSAGYSWDTILSEIAKCEVVCANCHVRRSAERGGYWRSNLTTDAGLDSED